MVKTLVVYYSRTGTTKKVAEEIAKAMNSDIEEIIDKTDRNGPIGWLKSGKDAMRKKITVINEITKSPANYDLIVIGSPLWAGSVTPAIRTYMTQQKQILFEKKVAFFSTMGSPNPGKIFIQMEELYGKKPVSNLSLRTKEVTDGSFIEKMKKFIEDLKK